jgi:hypothetical protein
MDGILDEALELIGKTAPDFANGNTNHAPMVAETLVQLGRADAVTGWLDAYRRDLQERPSERPPLSVEWREGLGRLDLWPEWVSLFRRELADRPWQEVLEIWVARLAPGLSGEATHGLIRTAHAVRAIAKVETEPRRNELADGLAYWAAGYHSFGQMVINLQHFDLDEALSRVPELNPPPGANIDKTLAGLDDSGEFAPVVNLLATGPDPLADLSKLTERFAAVYLANSHDPARVFAVVHAVTGPSALRLLAPHITPSAQELLLIYAWQVAAAIYGVWGKDHAMPDVPVGTASNADLAQAAVANGAAHAIKLVEACQREYAVNPKPIFLAASFDATQRLTG